LTGARRRGLGIRFRVVALALVCTLGPVAGVGWWARTSVASRARESYERRLDLAVESTKRRVDERLAADRRVVDRLCERDFVVDRLLLDLAADRFDPARQSELVELVPPLMRSLGLDTLDLIDERHVGGSGVLASGHYSGRTGARDPQLTAAAARAGEAPFAYVVRLREDGEAHDARALLTSCVAERDRVRVRVVGGRVLDAAYVASVSPGADEVEVLFGEGAGAPADVPGRRKTIHVFAGADGAPAAVLFAVLDDRALIAQLAELDRGLLVGGGVAASLALAIGLFLALWLSRPLAALEDAAGRVASGDLETMVTARSGGEAGRALEAFNEMTQTLKKTQRRLLRAERIAAWRDIARRIAHEIKNPLSPIQLSIETMRKTYKKKHPDFDEIFEESTVAILEEVERLRKIVTEFSDFARLPRPKPVELDVRDVAKRVVSLHSGGDVHVALDAPRELPKIMADRDQLTQVLENLVKNAAEATSAAHGGRGGRVSVGIEPSPSGGGVVLRIGDDGPGIPEVERQRVFEPYHTTKAGGTGLGLAIVHRIVGDHGGTVEIGDSPLGGAEVIVQLPEAGPPPEASGSMTDTASPLVTRR
jgi:signal transduction histidine kinase